MVCDSTELIFLHVFLMRLHLKNILIYEQLKDRSHVIHSDSPPVRRSTVLSERFCVVLCILSIKEIVPDFPYLILIVLLPSANLLIALSIPGQRR